MLENAVDAEAANTPQHRTRAKTGEGESPGRREFTLSW